MICRVINFSVFIVILSVLSLFPESSKAQLTSPNPFCLPTCEVGDARLLSLTGGTNFNTFTPKENNLQIVVAPNSVEFSLGIFDGDSPGALIDGNWDLGVAGNFSYSVIIDPDKDNAGPVIFEIFATDLPNNDWADFSFPTSPQALDADGNYVYTLRIVLLDDVNTQNNFKVRSSDSLFLDEPFAVSGDFGSPLDIATVFPNSNLDDGIQAEDYAVSTYDGEICLFFQVPNEIAELTIWDADFDHGNQDGTDTDTDDQNTPNTIPDFAPPDSDAEPEGINPPAPFDDRTLTGESDFFNFTHRAPAVKYKVLFPDGREFENTNPSGNREWEQFVISSQTSNPNLTDFFTDDPIPEGLYQLCTIGLNMQNLVALRLPFPLVSGTGESPPVTPVPTISEWGLIAMAGVLGIIGLIAVRRRIRVSKI
ncbi:MAG: hypothetical protein DHS20C13_18120 [Thermodesulfobacteriota bacterium]|nr:MAG: hypothetical protein DHS20C13_18120 [Thermodesulfobacteriota bacterium]